MARAIWNGVVLAESPTVETVEGNAYFPPASVKQEYLRPNARKTTCPWKGTASYYDIVVGDDVLVGGAWHYPEPKDAARNITGHVAFYRQVTIEP